VLLDLLLLCIIYSCLTYVYGATSKKTCQTTTTATTAHARTHCMWSGGRWGLGRQGARLVGLGMGSVSRQRTALDLSCLFSLFLVIILFTRFTVDGLVGSGACLPLAKNNHNHNDDDNDC